MSSIGSQYVHSLFYEEDKQFVLESGSVPDQVTKEIFSSFYNPLHRVESILSPDPSTFAYHLTINMVDVSPSGAKLLIIDPSGAKSSIRIDSCFSSS